MSELRILYINTSAGWGGMEMHPLMVADELALRGNPLLFAVRRGTPTGRQSKGRRFAPLALPFRWYLDPGSFPVLQRVVRSFRINVVHVHASRDAWRAILLAGILRRNRVFVFSRHMGSPAGRRRTDPLHRLLVQRLDAMVAISGYIQRNILQTYPVHASRVKVIPYGLGPNVRGSPEGASRVRRKLNLQDNGLLVGLVAQVSPDKRQDLLIQAAARVVRSVPGCRFLLAGAPVHGPYAARVREMISSMGLEDHIHLAGFWKDIPSLMQALDILVIPSKAEAFGLVLLEAMANAKPIVGSNSGAVPEIVQHGRNGLLFSPGDEKELAAAITELLQDPDKRAEMGSTGEEMFQERFTLEREASETLDLYRSLLNGRR